MLGLSGPELVPSFLLGRVDGMFGLQSQIPSTPVCGRFLETYGLQPSPCRKTGFTAHHTATCEQQAKPEHANTQLGRQEWFSMDSAGNGPRPMSMLLSFAAPTPCALVLMHAASSCTVSIA